MKCKCNGTFVSKVVNEVQVVRNTRINCPDLLVWECDNCHKRAFPCETMQEIEKRIEEVFPDYYSKYPRQ